MPAQKLYINKDKASYITKYLRPHQSHDRGYILIWAYNNLFGSHGIVLIEENLTGDMYHRILNENIKFVLNNFI